MSSLHLPDFANVTLNGVELDAPGRLVLNSYVLMDGAPKRRNNRIRPGVAGVLGGKAYPTERTVQLEVFLDGNWDYAGAESSDVSAAVQSHILSLRSEILDDEGDAEGAVPCVVTTAVAGTTLEGLVQVDDLTAEPGVGAQIITFELTLIRGELVVVVAPIASA